ncbi:MAG: site-specific integrase [Deltaproteobacteria bacterium]|nr:site-specific integrase [Deltaproteobacteria bacterium]
MKDRPRGMGGVYLRGKIYWIRYSRNGHEIRETAETTDERKAWKHLNKRIEEAKRPEFVGPTEKKLGLDDLELKILADYERNEKRSAETVSGCLQHVKDYFNYDRLIDITPSRIEAYQQHRLAEGAARATVNREMAYLRRGYNLLFKAHEISYRPEIQMLQGEKIREGFINKAEFEAVAEHLEKLDADDHDIVRFLYNSAWRSGEAKKLEWSKVDLDNWIIRLTRKNEKTKHPRTLPLIGELREVIERRLAKRRPDCPYVFHRNGRPIKDFRKAFKAACKAAGLMGLVPHDMRRSAIRNFRKSGISEIEGMKFSGHKTNAVYKRYDIVDEEDLRKSMEKVQEHLKREAEDRKVVPLKRAG